MVVAQLTHAWFLDSMYIDYTSSNITLHIRSCLHVIWCEQWNDKYWSNEYCNNGMFGWHLNDLFMCLDVMLLLHLYACILLFSMYTHVQMHKTYIHTHKHIHACTHAYTNTHTNIYVHLNLSVGLTQACPNHFIHDVLNYCCNYIGKTYWMDRISNGWYFSYSDGQDVWINHWISQLNIS